MQVFFVLSGYLIAQQLKVCQTLFQYAVRRAAKIGPVYLLYLTTAYVAATIAGVPTTDFAWFLTPFGNVRISAGPIEAAGLLQHLWSLAVEIQLYALAPLLLPIITQSRLGAAGLIVLGVVLRIVWAARFGAQTGWGATPALDVFAIGMALAVYRPALRLPKALGNPMLTWFGRISYSLYIWHLLVFAAVGDRGPVAVALAIGVAAASYYAVERPASRHQPRMKGLPLIACSSGLR